MSSFEVKTHVERDFNHHGLVWLVEANGQIAGTQTTLSGNRYRERIMAQAFVGSVDTMVSWISDELNALGGAFFELARVIDDHRYGNEKIAYLHHFNIPRMHRASGRAALLWKPLIEMLRELQAARIYTLYGPSEEDDGRVLRAFMQMRGFRDTEEDEGPFPILCADIGNIRANPRR